MEVVIALLMFMGGETQTLKEHLYIQDQKMSTCLKMQRQARKSTNGGRVVYQCAKVKATIIIDEYSKNKKITSIASLDD